MLFIMDLWRGRGCGSCCFLEEEMALLWEAGLLICMGWWGGDWVTYQNPGFLKGNCVWGGGLGWFDLFGIYISA
jgi:hypothetical protein